MTRALFTISNWEPATKWGSAFFNRYAIPRSIIRPRVRTIDLYKNLDRRRNFSRTAKISNFIVGIGHGNACYSDDTEILTEDGWRLFKDLDDNTKVATLNQKTEELEYQKPIRFYQSEYNGDMFYQKGRTVDILVTPNHNLFVSWLIHEGKYHPFTFLKPEDIKKIDNRDKKGRFTSKETTYGRLKFKRDAKWKGKDEKWFILPSVKIKFKNQYSGGTTLSEKIKDLLVRGLNQSQITKQLGCSQSLVTMVALGERGKKQEKILSRKKILMDDWLRFFGIWLAEGCTSLGKGKRRRKSGKIAQYYSHRVTIAQNNREKRQLIRKWLEAISIQIGFKFWEHKNEHSRGFEFKNKQIYQYLKKFGKAKEKYVPKNIKNLSSRQLKILLDAMVLGDGSVSRGGDDIGYSTTSKRLADDVQEIALKIGYAATIYKKNDNRGPKYNTQYKVNILTTERMNHLYSKKARGFTNYHGMVYSVEVPNHIIYVRRNGKPCWCGNSTYTGQNAEVLLKVGQYDPEEVKGKVVKLLSCLVGRKLGPDLVRNGASGFQGYTEEFVFALQMKPRFWLFPWMDKVAANFLVPPMMGIRALLDGKTNEEAYEIEYNKFTENMELEGDPEMRAMLKHNRDSLVILGDPNARI